MSGIARVFAGASGRGVLIAYLMGGDPTPAVSLKAVRAAVAGGADIVELGIPFSDPIADGRTIQAAGTRALAAGTRPRDVLEIARRTKTEMGVPVVLMAYSNTLQAAGTARFLEAARRSGVDGMIIPDMPADESTLYVREARKRSIDTVMLAAPTTPDERLKSLARATSGFLYLVSLLGVTGARADLSADASRLVSRARRCTEGRVPLAVGFGISKPEHVRQVLRAGADAAIVGSAIVGRVGRTDRSGAAMLKDVEDYVRSMKLAARLSRRGRRRPYRP